MQLACEDCHNPYSGGYCGGVPPLPIPNREVKPACADGTAMQCGRVGGRHFFEEPLSHTDLRAFFCVAQIPQTFFIVRRRNALSSLAPRRLLRYERAHRRRGKGAFYVTRGHTVAVGDRPILNSSQIFSRVHLLFAGICVSFCRSGNYYQQVLWSVLEPAYTCPTLA